MKMSLVKSTFLGLLLAAATLLSATEASAQNYGILWQNTTTGHFGVWRVGDEGNVRGTFDLTTTDKTYAPWPVPGRPNTYYYICGANVRGPNGVPYDPSGCSNNSLYSITQLFPQHTSGFDFLFYNHIAGGMSPQFADFSGNVVTPGHPLRNWNGSGAVCDEASGCAAAWKMVGTGTFDHSGAPSLLWYNAGAGQFGVWQISGFDAQTVTNYASWSACGGSCAAYGVPVGAADFNGDGITDILWLASDGRLTVFLEDGFGGHRAQALSRTIPLGFSLVGVRREQYNPLAATIRLVFYNPFSGVLQNWKLNPSNYDISASNLTWTCNGCFPDWRTVGLVPVQ
jgi:hypothetical protein